MKLKKPLTGKVQRHCNDCGEYWVESPSKTECPQCRRLRKNGKP